MANTLKLVNFTKLSTQFQTKNSLQKKNNLRSKNVLQKYFFVNKKLEKNMGNSLNEFNIDSDNHTELWKELCWII